MRSVAQIISSKAAIRLEGMQVPKITITLGADHSNDIITNALVIARRTVRPKLIYCVGDSVSEDNL